MCIGKGFALAFVGAGLLQPLYGQTDSAAANPGAAATSQILQQYDQAIAAFRRVLAIEQLTGDDHYGYTLQIQTAGDPAKITGEVRTALAQIDPNLPILDSAPLTEVVDHLIDREKFVSQLSGFFSLLALALACIGLYGVMTWNVVRRTSEIGIRMALGAARHGVLWMVLKESLLLLVIGILIGIPISLAASRVIRAGLFGVSPSDPLTFIAAAAIIAAVIVAAAWLPARRATRIDPMVALRYE